MSTTRNTQPSWRQRMLEKERQEREALARAAEAERQKQYANTEANFPTTLVTTARPTKSVLPAFAKTAAEAEEREIRRRQREAYANSQAARERRDAMHTVAFRHRRGQLSDDVDDEIPEAEATPDPTLNERYPPHGRRGTYTDPDSDGWRLVTKRQRRKRELTDAELEKKYRNEILNEDGSSEGSREGWNDDLMERNNRELY